jgi:hypothetical protein
VEFESQSHLHTAGSFTSPTCCSCATTARVLEALKEVIAFTLDMEP